MNRLFRLALSTTAAMAGLLITRTALATEYTAYDVEAATVGNQNFTGALGMDFDVGAAPIFIYELGVFDDNQDGLMLPLVARIYNRDNAGAAIVKIDFAAGATGTLRKGSRFLSLPCPLALPAGFHGTIEADGYGNTERNGNGSPTRATQDGGGAITFLGGGRFGGDPLTFPPIVDGGPANPYAAGTFTFAVACAVDGDCSNADHPKCGGGGLCGKAAGTFFPACTGATAACNTSTATCAACDGNLGAAAATKACSGPLLPACTAGACNECNATKTCTGAVKPVCSGAGACVICNTDALGAGDDAATGNRCPTTTNPYCKGDGTCGKCTTNTDCAARAGRPYCAPDGSCSKNCDDDADCGTTASAQICDGTTKLCITGCRGTGGNGCPTGVVCSSVDATQGTCSTPPVDAGSEAGSSSSSGTSGTAGSSGASGTSGSTPDAGGGSSGDDGGCAVTTTTEGSMASFLAAGVLGALVLSAVRRRRR